MAVVRASFFSTQFRKYQDFAFALSNSFGTLLGLFYLYLAWQTSKPAFAFSQDFFTESSLLVSNQTGFTALSFYSFNNRFIFRLFLSKIENNAKISGGQSGTVFCE